MDCGQFTSKTQSSTILVHTKRKRIEYTINSFLSLFTTLPSGYSLPSYDLPLNEGGEMTVEIRELHPMTQGCFYFP